jgi:cytochrome c-type biogenesis protein CcmH
VRRLFVHIASALLLATLPWSAMSQGASAASGTTAAPASAAMGSGTEPARKAAAAPDPALEAQVMKISAGLRCLVCQNQTIADSNADLAIDLRNQVRTMLERGQTPAQINDYMTARYGDFVLYKPPVRSTTALLWYGPAALLVLAVLVLVWIIRRRTKLPADRFEPDPDGP